jgi:hypothetical protein
VQIIQPNTPSGGSKAEEIGSQIAPINIHILLTLAKLALTIQSQTQEEEADGPHNQSNPQPAIPMEPIVAPAAGADQSPAGTVVDPIPDGASDRGEKGGGA